MRDLGSVPGLGRSPGEGKGYPPQYSGLENSMDTGAWQATVHGGAKSQIRLRDIHFQGFLYNLCIPPLLPFSSYFFLIRFLLSLSLSFYPQKKGIIYPHYFKYAFF